MARMFNGLYKSLGKSQTSLQAQAILELRRRSGKSTTDGKSFHQWLLSSFKDWNWEWPHVRFIVDQLDRVTSGEINKLILEIPPRHGKTELATIRYPVWRLKQNPSMRVIVGAYNQTLANRYSRSARRIAEVNLPLSRVAVEEWETSQYGVYRAVGVGAGVTGQGADLIIIDDPVKSRAEANSKSYRDRMWDWYRTDIYSRFEPGAAIVLIMTRWHLDDLAGRILASDDARNWTEIRLPAEAEENDPLGRSIGDALCPDRFDGDALAKIRGVLGTSYYALYQQRPIPMEGGMFRREWFDIVGAVPTEGTKYVRYWDKAGTQDGGAYTAGVLMAKTTGGIYYVVDVKRGQWSAMNRESVIRQTSEADREQYGAVRIWIEQEPGSGGLESAQATIRNLAGFAVRADPVRQSKDARAENMAAQCEARNIKLVRGYWNNSYIDELCAIGAGAYRDQCDASSGAFNKLALGDGLGLAIAFSDADDIFS